MLYARYDEDISFKKAHSAAKTGQPIQDGMGQRRNAPVIVGVFPQCRTEWAAAW